MTEASSPTRRRALIGALALGALLVASIALAQTGALEQLATGLTNWVETSGVLGVVTLALIYVVWVVALLPSFPLTMAAGVLWGAGRATALVVPVATLGCTLAFLSGRYLFRDLVEARARQSPRFAALDRATAKGGLGLVLLLRLSPVLPYNLLNYSLGVTQVRVLPYVLGSALGMIPVTFMWAQLGATAGSLAGAGDAPTGIETQVVRVLSLVATIAVTVVITRVARRTLSADLGESEA